MKCQHVIEHFAESEKSCELLLKKWNVINELKSILHIPYTATVVLQNNAFTMSDFYGCLKIIDLKLNQIVQSSSIKFTTFAQKLQSCVNNRMEKLVENPLMLCSLFLDPRFKFSIDTESEKLNLAKRYITSLWEKIKTMKSDSLNEGERGAPNMDVTPDNMTSFYEELDSHLSQSTGLQNLSTANTPIYEQNKIHIAISKYERSILGFRMKSNESIHSFWENKKGEFGLDLYEVASVLFAVPPTQASVERNFSALKYLFTVHRYNLSEDLLESLLIIHLNQDFFISVKESEIMRNCRSK